MTRRIALTTALLATIVSGVSSERREVLLASRRAGWIEILSRETLEPLSRLRVAPMAESVSAAGDGRTLFVAQAMRSMPDGCCALFALDLAKRAMTFVIEPAMEATFVPSANVILTQRGGVGVDVFDATSLQPLPRLASRAPYRLHPSPDGRWLFALTDRGDQLTANTTEGPALHVFDLSTGERIRLIPVPYERRTGAWLDGLFYMFGFDFEQGRLWTVQPDANSLGGGRAVALPPDVTTSVGRRHNPFRLIASAGRLFLHEMFGTKGDNPTSRLRAAEGFFEIEPDSARIVRRWAPEAHFARLVADERGETFYGIDVPNSQRTAPRLVKIDRGTGTEVVRELPDDVWNLALASLAPEWIGSGEVRIDRDR
jgi:hypothetical protein